MTAQPPWVWCRVVRACTALSPIEKLVWDEERGLATGRGATMGAGPLGLRLGVSRETIERARRELARFGLLRKLDLGAGRSAEWLPELPEGCRPPARCRRLTSRLVSARNALRVAAAVTPLYPWTYRQPRTRLTPLWRHP